MGVAFVDLNDGTVITESMLYAEWEIGRETDTETYSESFSKYLLEIILATINGRNDLEIVGTTPQETNEYMDALREKIRQIKGR